MRSFRLLFTLNNEKLRNELSVPAKMQIMWKWFDMFSTKLNFNICIHRVVKELSVPRKVFGFFGWRENNLSARECFIILWIFPVCEENKFSVHIVLSFFCRQPWCNVKVCSFLSCGLVPGSRLVSQCDACGATRSFLMCTRSRDLLGQKSN